MWINDTYEYSTHTLKVIANYYCKIYEGIPVLFKEDLINPWSLAEFKADFDLALNNVGRGSWNGKVNGDFNKYRPFGVLQRLIIADIMGIDDNELIKYHFKDIPRLRGYAYYLMREYLNTKKHIKRNEEQ